MHVIYISLHSLQHVVWQYMHGPQIGQLQRIELVIVQENMFGINRICLFFVVHESYKLVLAKCQFLHRTGSYPTAVCKQYLTNYIIITVYSAWDLS